MESLKDVCAGVHYRIGGVVSRHNPVWRVGKNWKPKKKKKNQRYSDKNEQNNTIFHLKLTGCKERFLQYILYISM